MKLWARVVCRDHSLARPFLLKRSFLCGNIINFLQIKSIIYLNIFTVQFYCLCKHYLSQNSCFTKFFTKIWITKGSFTRLHVSMIFRKILKLQQKIIYHYKDNALSLLISFTEIKLTNLEHGKNITKRPRWISCKEMGE